MYARLRTAVLSLSLTGLMLIFVTSCGLFDRKIEFTEQTDLTVSSVILPESTKPGAEFGSETKVTIYNQGTTVIPGGYSVEMVISADRIVPITHAPPTTTFIEDGLLPNGRVTMPTMQPETTFSFTIPGMTMVNDAPLDKIIFICAVVDPEQRVDEAWRSFPDGIGVNKLCMPLDIIP